MSINEIVLFSIVGSVLIFGGIEVGAVDDEFTIEKFNGKWYDMGKISTCEYDVVHTCLTHEIVQHPEDKNFFYDLLFSIENVRNCEYGAPIYIGPHSSGRLINSTIYKRKDKKTVLTSTIKSFNNGKQLIFTDMSNKKCASTSYRLWSKEAEVPMEIKFEFEKLAGNKTVKYYSWNDCPREQHETDNPLTLQQFEGVWYEIAIIFEDIDYSSCSFINVTVDYKEETFHVEASSLGTLEPAIYEGNIIGPTINIHPVPFDPDPNRISTASAVRCNNGTELMWRYGSNGAFGYFSRYRQVSAETMAELQTLAKKRLDTHLMIRSNDYCIFNSYEVFRLSYG